MNLGMILKRWWVTGCDYDGTGGRGSHNQWNVSRGVTLLLAVFLHFPFFIPNSHASSVQLPASGQTVCYNTAGTVIPCSGTVQDGAIQAGVTLPVPRFTDNSNGTLTDNLTGLIWLKNANCTATAGGIVKTSGTLTWDNALTWSNSLASGTCGLTDGSSAGQWRLPNRFELESLVNYGQGNSATWLNGQGFVNVRNEVYWSSSTGANSTSDAWYVYMVAGGVVTNSKLEYYYVWPVRGGQ